MEKIIPIKEGVSVEVTGSKVVVSGPKGKLERDFSSPLFVGKIRIEKTDNAVKVSTNSYRRHVKAEVGCIASHIRNMIVGVTDGYKYTLQAVYMHFPFTVKVVGNEVVISNFLGERALRKAKIIGDTKVDVHGEQITVSGNDVEAVGQTAANIERATAIPARDRRVFQDGIFLIKRE
ncbi:MAG: 50S ribosomal protein L6 [Candidatus Aenigmatarchaeota archaeon]|nr:50S ribosomal protein L6 [Candidatus Aenigmarchaeota archaeon]